MTGIFAVKEKRKRRSLPKEDASGTIIAAIPLFLKMIFPVLKTQSTSS